MSRPKEKPYILDTKYHNPELAKILQKHPLLNKRGLASVTLLRVVHPQISAQFKAPIRFWLPTLIFNYFL